MLAKAGVSFIPANAYLGLTRFEQFEVCRRPPKGVAFEVFGFLVRPPKDYSNINTAPRRLIQNIQHRPSAIWHLKRRMHESDGHPHTMARTFNGFANTPERWLAIN